MAEFVERRPTGEAVAALRRNASDGSAGGVAAVDSVWRDAWLLVVPAVVAAHLLGNLRYPRILSGGLDIYLAQPLTWASLGLLAYLGWKYGLRNRATAGPGLIGLSALVGAFQVALLVIAGLVFGFGYSPYGRQPAVMAGNLFYVVTMLIGVELARAYLIGVVGRARPLAGILLVSLLFTLVGIPLARLGSLSAPLPAFQMAGETFLPLMAQNLLTTFLALLGGPLPAILYRGALEAFEWASPILPNLPWSAAALVGTLGPVMGMLFVQSHVRAVGHEHARSGSPWPSAWLMPAFLGVLMIWFNQGFFGVTPTVVSGVSMVPMLQAGDLVLTADVAPEEIVVGDIVRFRAGEAYVLHRVIAVRGNGGLTFVTRGDANNVSDPPLPASRLEGKVIRILPGLGWPSIVVRQGMQWLLDRAAS